MLHNFTIWKTFTEVLAKFEMLAEINMKAMFISTI